MAFPILPNPSNFLGVALVINRSRDGPRFVFHYPPHIRPPQSRRGKSRGEDNEDGDGVDDDDHDDDDDDDDDILLERLSQPSKFDHATLAASNPAERLRWNQDDHLETDSGTQIVPWEYVAGFPTKDLESILTPARAYHKRPFQVSLDPLHCVSFPIHVPENGVWRKKRKQRRKDEDSGPEQEDEEAAVRTDDSALFDADQGDEARDTAKPGEKAAEEAEDKKSSMTMFNVVFILNPKKNKAKGLIDTMFDHVIREINQAYQYCQQRSDFVWKESKRILALKDKGREERTKMRSLWNEILSTSSLAASMQDLYEAVSQNKIAALQLDTPEGMVAHSFQTPVPFHIYDLPEEDEAEQARGLWLTTACSTLQDEHGVDEPGYLDRNCALLLLDDEKKIISELQSDTEAGALAMVEFVRHSKPTLSFHQVWQQPSNVLTPAQVRHFVRHFIYWRRAMSIPPLHARDMYIVSPNADMTRLPEAAGQWARRFPVAPALPDFLAELSAAPRPYKVHCPSKAHRPLYMAMLAWLLRGGWVTQLCTFAYVVVWPEIVYEVEYAREAEDLTLTRRRASQNRSEFEDGPGGGNFSGEDGGDEPMMASATTVIGDTLLPGFSFPPPIDHPSSGAAAPNASSDLMSSTGTLRFNPNPLPSLPHSRPTPSDPRPRSASSDDAASVTTTTSNSRELEATGYSIDQQDDNNNGNNTAIPSRPSSATPSDASTSPRPQTPTPAEQAAEQARLERIAGKAARELDERAAAHARRAPPCQTAHPSANTAPHLAGMAPYIILDAGKATGKESQYLSAIERRLHGVGGPRQDNNNSNNSNNNNRVGAQQKQERQAEQRRDVGRGGPDQHGDEHGRDAKELHGHHDDPHDRDGDGSQNEHDASKTKDREREKKARRKDRKGGNGGGGGLGGSSGSGNASSLKAAEAWPRFCKYFDGRYALEHVALREDMKRKEVWGLLTAMGEYLLCVRHW